MKRQAKACPAMVLALAGWLVPGGAYLLTRRYLQFAGFAMAVAVTFGAGLAMSGWCGWPGTAELAGLDGFSALVFRGGAALKLLAGIPYLAVRAFGGSGSLLDSRLHEQGNTLLMMAGLLNVLSVSSALDLRRSK